MTHYNRSGMKNENMASLMFDYRRVSGLSQKAVAKKLGYGTSQFISNIERGLSTLPPKKFKEASKALSVKIELLISAYVADIAEELNRDLIKKPKRSA